MDQEAYADNRKNNEPKRHFENDALVAEETFLGNAPAIKEQQGRQEQQEEDVRIKLDPNICHRGYRRAKTDLYQGQRHWKGEDPDDGIADHHGQEHQQDNGYCFHGESSFDREQDGGSAGALSSRTLATLCPDRAEEVNCTIPPKEKAKSFNVYVNVNTCKQPASRNR
jgi:hypothetical protein